MELYRRLESNLAQETYGGEISREFTANDVSQSMDYDAQRYTIDNMGSQEIIREQVEMMPQDDYDAKSANDLGFMTEVDAEFNVNKGHKESQHTSLINSTKHSEMDGDASMPRISSMLEIEKTEFKMVI